MMMSLAPRLTSFRLVASRTISRNLPVKLSVSPLSLMSTSLPKRSRPSLSSPSHLLASSCAVSQLTGRESSSPSSWLLPRFVRAGSCFRKSGADSMSDFFGCRVSRFSATPLDNLAGRFGHLLSAFRNRRRNGHLIGCLGCDARKCPSLRLFALSCASVRLGHLFSLLHLRRQMRGSGLGGTRTLNQRLKRALLYH